MKRKTAILVGIIACSLISAGAVVVSLYLEWDALTTVSAFAAVGGVSTVVFTSILKGKIDIGDDDEEG